MNQKRNLIPVTMINLRQPSLTFKSPAIFQRMCGVRGVRCAHALVTGALVRDNVHRLGERSQGQIWSNAEGHSSSP